MALSELASLELHLHLRNLAGGEGFARVRSPVA
jgi:hypothetical protein